MGDVRALPWITDPSKPLNSQPDLALIAELSSLLQMAKDGELIGIAYAMQFAGGGYGWGWHGDDNHGLIGGVSMLDHRLKESEAGLRQEMDLPEPC